MSPVRLHGSFTTVRQAASSSGSDQKEAVPVPQRETELPSQHELTEDQLDFCKGYAFRALAPKWPTPMSGVMAVSLFKQPF
jgi:hypothetical protein